MPETSFNWSSLAPAIPEIYLGTAVCVLLLFDAFVGVQRRGMTATLTLLTLAGGAALTAIYGHVDGRTLLFDGLYVADELAYVLKLIGFLVVAVVLLYSRRYLDVRGLLRGKYFVLGAIASGTLLYGMSMIYGLTGTLSLDQLATTLRAGEGLGAGVILGLVFIVVAVAFKLGAVPFHMWLPDVYHGAPTVVTLFIGTAPKIAYFALTLRLLAQGLQGASDEWTQMLAILAVLTLILGNVVAIAQTNLKRMLAYSTIANVGFILLGFVAGTPAGYSAALFYTLVYVLVALGSFGVIVLASRKGFEADELEHYKGLHARDPLLAAIMMMLMFSTAGVPPFVGFWAKLRIIQELWATGYTWLVILAATVSVIGAFYYLRIVKLMYFDSPGTLPQPERNTGVRFALALNAAAVLVLGLLPGPLLDLCARLL